MSGQISQGIDPSMTYLSSSFKSSNIDSTLSRMLGNEVQGKEMFCSKCGKKTEIGYRNPNASAEATELYCKEHYESMFAYLCEGCNKPIVGIYAVDERGKKYHQQCFGEDFPCANCSQRIIGEVVKACGKHWHPKCFKCTTCYTSFDGLHVDRGGFPYCKKCASEIVPSKRVVTVQKNSTVTAGSEETKGVTEDIYSNIQKGKLFCAECGKIISVNDAVSHGNAVFHVQCFCCAKCKKMLSEEKSFKTVNGKPHCLACAGSSSSTGVGSNSKGNSGGKFCAGCGSVLSGTCVKALDGSWHKDCLRCSSCNQPIGTSTFVQRADKLLCQTCVGPPITTAHAGFTVDPRTGKKKYSTTPNSKTADKQ